MAGAKWPTWRSRSSSDSASPIDGSHSPGRDTRMSEDNRELMQTLDDAWNAQDWDTFEKRHAADTAVYWPGQATPTRGVHNHRTESEAFFKTFENQLDNRPYKVLISD